MTGYTPVYNEFGQLVGYRWKNKFGQEQTSPVAGGTWGAVPVPPPPPVAPRDMTRRDRLFGVARKQDPAQPPASPWSTNYQLTGTPWDQQQQQSSSENLPLAKQLYQKFAGNVQGNLSGNPTDQDYTQSDRRYNAASRAWEQTLNKRAEVSALQANPMWALPPSTVSEADYNWWGQLPLGQLAMLTQGATGPDRFSESANRMERAMRQTANSYQNLDASTLLANLFGANRNSALGRAFQTQAEPNFRTDDNGIFQGMKEGKWQWSPASQQAGVMQSYLNAIYGTQYPQAQQQPAMDYVNRLINQWASRQYGRNKPGSLINWLGNQMGY